MRDIAGCLDSVVGLRWFAVVWALRRGGGTHVGLFGPLFFSASERAESCEEAEKHLMGAYNHSGGKSLGMVASRFPIPQVIQLKCIEKTCYSTSASTKERTVVKRQLLPQLVSSTAEGGQTCGGRVRSSDAGILLRIKLAQLV